MSADRPFSERPAARPAPQPAPVPTPRVRPRTRDELRTQEVPRKEKLGCGPIGAIALSVLALVLIIFAIMANPGREPDARPDFEVIPTQPTAPPTAEGQTEAGTELTCDDAAANAAAVPLSRDNNAEIFRSLDACDSLAEWFDAVVAHPAMFGQTSIPREDIRFYVQAVCFGEQMSSRVCSDPASGRYL